MARRRLGIHKTLWPLKAPFRISGYTFENINAVVVEISEEGEIGRGEGVGVYYLDETADLIVDQIEALRGQIENGISNEELQNAMPTGGARNAIDCALWDLKAKLSKKSIWELVGVAPKPVQTVYTIGIESSAIAMAEKAIAASSYELLKIKLNGDDPSARMRAIRAARPDAEIVIDANQGLTPDLVREFAPVLAECDVKMLEQPLPRGDDLALAGIESSALYCADESCLNLEEVDGVLDRYDMINIKLDKCGGLTEALSLAEKARSCDKKLMVGNMLGSSLSMAPAYVVAQLCDFVDLDGPLNAVSDYLDGMVYDRSNVLPPKTAFWGNMHLADWEA